MIQCGFTALSYTASEGDGTLSASVELTADSGIPLSDFTALVSTVDGSALGELVNSY